MSVRILDNAFTPEEISAIHQECLTIPCKWGAVKSPEWQFWNGFVYTNFFEDKIDDIDKYPVIQKAWKTIQQASGITDNEYKFASIYINCQSIGNESPIHHDGSDLTVLYYTNPNWKIDWDGGTTFYNNEKDDYIGSVAYRAGRFLTYDKTIPHKPQAISIHAKDIRVVLVFRLNRIK